METSLNGVVIGKKKKTNLSRDSSFRAMTDYYETTSSSSSYKSLGEVALSAGSATKGKVSKNPSLPPYARNAESRASYNERRSRPQPYRSNTSLDDPPDKETPLREYGSHGSLDVLSRFDPPPVAVSTLQRKSEEQHPPEQASPKSKKKTFFNEKSLFKKFRGHPKETEELDVRSSHPIYHHHHPNNNNNTIHHHLHHHKTPEDRHRRRFFAHYDISSVCASLSPTGHLKTLERRNTTTGASAASAALRHSRETSESSADADQGDHISNKLVLSCPYFRNEVGGEVERNVALSRETCQKRNSISHRHSENSNTTAWHTPAMARGFSLLDNEESYWKNGYCPYRKVPTNIVERVDQGASFFKKHFYGKEHQNWFGIDENLGAVAISIRREKVVHDIFGSGVGLDDPMKDQYMYRIMFRSSELLPLRGCVLEESIPALKSEKIKTIPTKEVLEFICPELTLSSLHLGVQSSACEEELIKLDEAYVHNKYKVGLMYCREGQQTEEEMYNNEEGGAAFNEFLEMIGQKVRLKGFSKYKAGLCNKNDSTGLYSVYTEHENGSEIMFHVSTLLPFTNSNRQQLPRKRYIGNDIVTVVFQEPGALPFIPNIKSQFQHVFIVVQAHNPCSENTQYSVAVSRSKSVPMFGPPIPEGAMFPKSKAFANFLLTKIINAENAAHHSDKFVSMAIRTRQELLKDLTTNFSSPTTLESGSKFSIFGPKKKDKLKPRFSPDASLRGALSWRVVAEDCLTRQEVYAFVAISADSIILVLDNVHRDVMFVTTTRSILGWTALANSIRIYFHQGEALILHSKDWETEDMSEIAQRLKAVTTGAPTQEFTLRRNQMGQLGFHVQHDGLITEVENYGYAWQTGLRQGSRLVEICKHHVTTLTHEHMVDLLKTSMTVTVTVIPPHPDGSPRVGCNLKNCPHPYGSPSEGDYENLSNSSSNVGDSKIEGSNSVETKQGCAQQPSNSKMCYERSVSPPRSTGSSGYGTGSSRKSLTEQRFPVISQENTLTSSSSGHSSDDRWYDFSDHNHVNNALESNSESTTPPPLPNRVLGNKLYPVQTQQIGLPSVYPRTSYSSSLYFDSSNSNPNKFDYGEEKRTNDAKVTYLTEYELNQPSTKPVDLVLQHERLAALKTSSASSTPVSTTSYVIDGGNTTDSSSNSNERIPPQRSEDELSASSISLSPQRQRRTYGGGSLTPSSQGSRNQSPKNVLLRSSYDGDVQPKKKLVARSSNRNSASLNSNTLQENLMKLIGPELNEDNNSKVGSNTPLVSSTASSSIMKKCGGIRHRQFLYNILAMLVPSFAFCTVFHASAPVYYRYIVQHYHLVSF
uniref:Signal-induced proliferation-associated 1-like protein 2 n=1 Tax=Lepeophtheirus salmonis TaxID=72036 RepID=A0A0K2UKS9_LEPSM